MRFYGGNPLEWFDVPYWLLEAHLNMMPKLRAQEALNNFYVMGLAQPPGAAAQSQQELAARRRREQDVQRVIKDMTEEAQLDSQSKTKQKVKLPPEVAMALMRSSGIDVMVK